VYIKVNTLQFNKWFAKNRAFSRRGLAEDLNQSAYSVAIAAAAITKRGSKPKIREYLKSSARIAPSAPIAALIINKRRGEKGLQGLYGAEMKAAVVEFIQKQADSINFLRAGWLPAVVEFARAIGKSPGKNAIQYLSRFGYQGGGSRARPGQRPLARLWNSAFSRNTSTPAGIKHAEEGLQKALNQETRRMADRVARKLAAL
jgi:hypothetical protein